MGPAFPSTSKMCLKTMQKRSQETALSASQPFSAEQAEGLGSAVTISFAGHVASKAGTAHPGLSAFGTDLHHGLLSAFIFHLPIRVLAPGFGTGGLITEFCRH